MDHFSLGHERDAADNSSSYGSLASFLFAAKHHYSLIRQYIQELLDGDVLCGRGPGVYLHPGNRSYLDMVRARIPEYRAMTDRRDKTNLSRSIVNQFRFVNQDEDGRFYVISNEQALRKTSQALREGSAAEN